MTLYMHPRSSRGRRSSMCLDVAAGDDQQIRIQLMTVDHGFSAAALTGPAKFPDA